MKRLFLLLAVITAGIQGQAQSENSEDSVGVKLQSTVFKPLFGYLSYDAALRGMPEYNTVKEQMEQLRKKYDEEQKTAEDEFNRKYEAFLEGRKDFPRTILLKRQTELQELLERNIAFKKKSQQELQNAEAEAMKPLYERLNAAIAAVAKEAGLTLVLNTDNNACPYTDPDGSIDISTKVADMLGVK